MDTQTEDSSAPHRFGPGLGPIVLGAAGGSLLTLALIVGATHLQDRASAANPPAPGQAPVASAPASPAQAPPAGAIAAIYQKARPAVVEIDVRSARGSGLGTGVVISNDGEILTNAHVVSGARTVQVKLSDGSTLPGQVLGVQQDDDLAIVKAQIPAQKLSVIKMGDSTKLQVGEQVVAIGNPFGLEGSVTQGIVSGLRRDNGNDGGPADAIQIDAAINPGNSGGPLLDMNGNLIGINEALENPTGENVFIGVGFAIPINTAKADLAQLQASGSGSSTARGSQGQPPAVNARPSSPLPRNGSGRTQ